MKLESSVVSVSWIPEGAIEGMVRVPFEMGVARNDMPPPDRWSGVTFPGVRTLHLDGLSDFEVVGASSFPRHWIYDRDGRLVAKSGFIDFETWYRESFGDKSPWGEEDSPAITTAVESVLERHLSAVIIEADPSFRRLSPGEPLGEQDEQGEELFLLFDGALRVEQDGRAVVETGAGAILGEMALLEGGRRTATLRAVTPCRVAVVPGDRVNRDMLAELARRWHGEPS